MATVSITDWDTKKNIEVDANTTSPGSGKVQAVILDGSLSEGTTGNGSIGYNTADIDTTDTQSKLESIVFTDSDESTTKDYEVENPDDLGTTTDVTVWVYDSAWTADGTVQLVLGTGTGDGSDYSVAGVGSNPWDNGQNAERVYHLNESSGQLIDSSPNQVNSSTTNGTTYDVSGEFDGARGFDGTDDSIQFNDTVTSISSTPITITAWADVLTDGSQQALLGEILSGEERRFGMVVDGAGLLTYYNGDSGEVNSSISVTDDTTHLLSIAVDATDDIDYYIDETTDTGSSAENWADSANLEFWIGARQASSGSWYWDGFIDAIRIYSEHKSSSWHAAEYDASPKGGQVFFSQQAAESTAVNIALPESTGTGTTPNPQVAPGNVNILAPVTQATGATPNPAVFSDLFVSIPVSQGNSQSPTPTVVAGNTNVALQESIGTGTTPNPSLFISDLIRAPTSTGTGTTPNPTIKGGVTNLAVPTSTGTGSTPNPELLFNQVISAKVSQGIGNTPEPNVTGEAVTITMPVTTADSNTPNPIVSIEIVPRDSSTLSSIKRDQSKTLSGDINK